MDVDSLRAELENHLANNPDEHAPHGFRDRFDSFAEQYLAADDDSPKAALEQELQQIRDEAEAAAKAAGEAGAPAPRAEPTPPRAQKVEAPAAAVDPVREIVDAHVNPAEPGFMQRYGVAVIILAVVLAGAWYFFRR